MKIIKNINMPHANGHYSQCVEHNGILYLSGQLPFVPSTRELPEGIKDQALQALNNVENILNSAGSRRDKVLQVRIYISDISLWDDVNAVYSEFFGPHKPARCVVPVKELHFGALVEIEVTAVL
jgi:2-iminobutanoate/2-iminopropanoate deaminase